MRFAPLIMEFSRSYKISEKDWALSFEYVFERKAFVVGKVVDRLCPYMISLYFCAVSPDMGIYSFYSIS